MHHLSLDMRFPTMWYVRPAKPQISLRILAVWSEPLLVAWILVDFLATDQTSFGVSKLKRTLHRLVWVYTCQIVTLLEITCRGSNFLIYPCMKCCPFCNIAWLVPTLCCWGDSSLKIFGFPPVLLKRVAYAIPTLNWNSREYWNWKAFSFNLNRTFKRGWNIESLEILPFMCRNEQMAATFHCVCIFF